GLRVEGLAVPELDVPLQLELPGLVVRLQLVAFGRVRLQVHVEVVLDQSVEHLVLDVGQIAGLGEVGIERRRLAALDQDDRLLGRGPGGGGRRRLGGRRGGRGRRRGGCRRAGRRRGRRCRWRRGLRGRRRGCARRQERQQQQRQGGERSCEEPSDHQYTPFLRL